MFTADCWIPTYNKEREHMGKKVYACFGGFSDQFWTRLKTPDFRGNCDGLTICELDMESGRLHLISQGSWDRQSQHPGGVAGSELYLCDQ